MACVAVLPSFRTLRAVQITPNPTRLAIQNPASTTFWSSLKARERSKAGADLEINFAFTEGEGRRMVAGNASPWLDGVVKARAVLMLELSCDAWICLLN